MEPVVADSELAVVSDATLPAGKPAGRAPSRWSGRWGRKLAPWLFLAPALAVLLAFTYYPLARSIQLSFYKWNLLGVPKPTGFANYQYLFDSDDFRKSIWVTVIFTLGNIVGTYLLAFGAAVLLRRPFAGVKFVRGAALIPTAIPMIVAGLTWRWMLEPSDGVVDQALNGLGVAAPNWLFDPNLALCSVIFVSIWRDFGIYMLVLLGGLLAIPREVDEAADLDGARGLFRLRTITMPQIAAANVFVVVMVLFNSVKAFDQIWVMTQGGPGSATTTILAFVFRAVSSGSVGIAAAASVLLFVVIAALVVARNALERRQAR